MKTSFYFFLWIIIYPLLGLLHSPAIDRNAFIVALAVVWGVSWFINRNMPLTLRYERIADRISILEDVFSGNVRAFRRRISRTVTLDFITAVYLGVGFIFVLFSMARGGDANDWFALLIFGFFAFATISRAVRLNKVTTRLHHNPTPQECAAVVDDVYHLNYADYYNGRLHASPEAMLPPRPRHFTAFEVFSALIAVACALLGIYYLVSSLIMLTAGHNPEAISGGIMYFLYGSLAAYFGIRDAMTCIAYLRRR